MVGPIALLQSAGQCATIGPTSCAIAIDGRLGKSTGRRPKWQSKIARHIPLTPRTRSIRRIRSPLAGPFGPLGPTETSDMLEDLPHCWWAATELEPWRKWEAEDMAVGYPSFRLIVRRRYQDFRRVLGAKGPETGREQVERQQCGEFVRVWQGPITPFPPEMPMAEVQAIVADLAEDRPVRVLADGALAHYEHCGGTHQPRREFQMARTLHGVFKVEIAYRRPPGCPIARSLSPRINRDHPLGPPPHLLNTIDALCVLFPADRCWVSGVHGARHYANFTAIWLAKHLAWEEARERGVGLEEAWPGSVVGHDPFELPRLVDARDPCRCGSGKEYGACCAAGDKEARKSSSLRQRGRGKAGRTTKSGA